MLKKSSKGFTLVELLVVIAIIGILATLATVSLNSARSKARDAKRISDLKQMATAMELWNTDNNTYVKACNSTSESAGLITSDVTSGCTVANPYITWSAIKDPSGSTTACAPGSGAPCAYTLGTGGITSNAYKICTYLENANSGIGLGAAGVACITQTGWVVGF